VRERLEEIKTCGDKRKRERMVKSVLKSAQRIDAIIEDLKSKKIGMATREYIETIRDISKALGELPE